MENQYSLSADEETMILLFAQWCKNQNLDPVMVYQQAYPTQVLPPVLLEALEKTVPKEESVQVPFDLLIEWLCSYGNDELAFVLTTLKSGGELK